MKIVILDAATIKPNEYLIESLAQIGETIPYDYTAANEILDRCQGADIVITNKVPLDGKTIESLPALKYIGVMATGFNIIDIKAARSRGIVVSNVPAYSTDSVAQLVFAHILNVAQKVDHYAEEVRHGDWSHQKSFYFTDTRLIELAGLTLGIYGLGNIGKRVAEIGHAFGMNILAFTSKQVLPEYISKAESVEELFSKSDVLSLHCPLTSETADIVNPSTLGMMKRSAILVNTSRGGLVDEDALATALNEGKIAAACLDVLKCEPPHADNPLLKAKNCYITPHIAWASESAMQRLTDVIISNVRNFVKGTPANNVAL